VVLLAHATSEHTSSHLPSFFSNFFRRYLKLARAFANGGAFARKLRQKLKVLRMKRGGLYDAASWTIRFSRVVKM
jgi:hypothetical protein